MDTHEIRNSEEATRIIREKENELRLLHMARLDLIARKRGWKLEGQDVLYKLFAEKYHWTPSQVRALTYEETDALLEGEPE